MWPTDDQFSSYAEWPGDRPSSREEERVAGHGDGDGATTSAAADLPAGDYMIDDQEQDGAED